MTELSVKTRIGIVITGTILFTILLMRYVDTEPGLMSDIIFDLTSVRVSIAELLIPVIWTITVSLCLLIITLYIVSRFISHILINIRHKQKHPNTSGYISIPLRNKTAKRYQQMLIDGAESQPKGDDSR